jgi:chromosome segregation ATPase
MPSQTFVAVHRFTSDNTEELSFEKGDVITVTDQSDTSWWIGTLNGKSGYVPSTYLKQAAEQKTHGSSDSGELQELKKQMQQLLSQMQTSKQQWQQERAQLLSEKNDLLQTITNISEKNTNLSMDVQKLNALLRKKDIDVQAFYNTQKSSERRSISECNKLVESMRQERDTFDTKLRTSIKERSELQQRLNTMLERSTGDISQSDTSMDKEYEMIKTLRDEMKNATVVNDSNLSFTDTIKKATERLSSVILRLQATKVEHASSKLLLEVLEDYGYSCMTVNDLYMNQYE